jgi:hypothetical protein
MREWIGSHDLEEFLSFRTSGTPPRTFYFPLPALSIWGGVFETILYNFKLIALTMTCRNAPFRCGSPIGSRFSVVKVIGDYLERY